MSWIGTNIRGAGGKRCAFCKYWYDPTNNAIQPDKPRIGLWKYDSSIKRYCSASRIDRNAWQYCKKFEPKIEEMVKNSRH